MIIPLGRARCGIISSGLLQFRNVCLASPCQEPSLHLAPGKAVTREQSRNADQRTSGSPRSITLGNVSIMRKSYREPASGQGFRESPTGPMGSSAQSSRTSASGSIHFVDFPLPRGPAVGNHDIHTLIRLAHPKWLRTGDRNGGETASDSTAASGRPGTELGEG